MLLIMSNVDLFAQINPIDKDSLLRVAETLEKPKDKADAYLALAEAYKLESTSEVHLYAGFAMDYATQADYQLGIAKALGHLTWAERRYGNMDKAVDLGRKALDAANKLDNDAIKADANYELAAVVNQGKQAKDHADARRLFMAARPYYKKIDDIYGIGKCMNGVGESFRREGKYDSAMMYYDSAAVHFKAIHHTKGIILLRNNRGLVFKQQKNYIAALDSLASAQAAAKAENFTAVYLEAGHAIAQIYLEQGELALAKEKALAALEDARVAESLNDQLECAKVLFEVAIKEEDYKTAITYQALAFEKETEIGNEAAMARYSSINNELEMQEQKVEINQLQNDRRVRKLWQLLLVVLLGLVFVVFVVLATAYRRNRRSSLLLAQQNEQLADLNREKDSLVNIVAHDLKSPLSKVKALSAMIGMAGPLTEKQQQALNLIGKVVDDGERLIQDLLDISQAEAVGLDLHYEEGEANALISDWMAPHRENATRKHILLEFHALQHPIPLRSELNYLSRIFDNLLSNALKYTPAERKVEVTSAVIGGKLHLSVRDEGPGISPEDQQKMFKKFQRLTARPTGGESSTGLGLSIIKTLSQRLHGDILVDSKLGEGSKFTLVVPLDQPKG